MSSMATKLLLFIECVEIICKITKYFCQSRSMKPNIFPLDASCIVTATLIISDYVYYVSEVVFQ